MTNGLWVQPEELGDLSTSEFALESARAASYILWSLSGRKYAGERKVTERYGAHIVPKTSWRPETWYSSTVDTVRMFAATVPALTLVNTSIRLRGTPITEIHSVTYADSGEEISPDLYYVVDHSLLRFHKTLIEDIEITYSYGFPAPVAGKMAARDMAMNFARLWGGDEDSCTFPDRVTSVSRQGVSWVLLDNQDFIENFRTGIYAVDLFLKATNPDKARGRSKVIVPGGTRAQRTTPKKLVLPESDLDVSVSLSEPGEVLINYAALDAVFLEIDPYVEPVIRIRSWAGRTSADLNNDNFTPQPGGLSVAFPYEDVVSTIGTKDPGTWDLLGYNEETETYIYIASGNLQIVH